MKWIKWLIILLVFVGCAHHGHHTTMWLNGVNLIEPWTRADIEDIVSHHPQIVRLPASDRNLWATDYLLSHGVLPLVVFDGAVNEIAYKNRIDTYINKFGARICYEILNEPIAMQGSPGYFDFANEKEVVEFMNRYIDYVHGRVKAKVLSCGIADVFGGAEDKLLQEVISKGHQDIISVHVYSCVNVHPIDWKVVWITEIGTKQDKVAFYNECLPRVWHKTHPQAMLWFDYGSKDFGLKQSPLWAKLF